MNEHDAFDAELAALKPQPPSSDLKSRIAEQLQLGAQPLDNPKRQAGRRIWRLSLALGLVLAVLGVVASRRPALRPQPQAPVSALDVAIAFDPSLPTVWSYHRAVSGSPQEINALLDNHSRTAPTPAAEFHVSAFPISPTELQSF